MHKRSLLITLLLISVLSACSQMSVGDGSAASKSPVDVRTLEWGEVISAGTPIDVEYSINMEDVVLNKLMIDIADSGGKKVYSDLIQQQPLNEWLPSIQPEKELDEGEYTMTLSFYSDDQLQFTEKRTFFVSSSHYAIRGITSYPPVLYPEGGGLFYADVYNSSEDCYLRWSLDGKKIASGMKSEGFQSIRITAPSKEGVYELDLEVFPETPSGDADYEFTSYISKSIPLYVNRDQKSGVNEFESEEDFHALFHFRGNLLNSVDPALSGVEGLTPAGAPQLSVKNGIFGYYLDKTSGFTSEHSLLPMSDGKLTSFSVMFSFIPVQLSSGLIGDSYVELFKSGYGPDYEVSLKLNGNGGVKADFVWAGRSFSLESTEAVVFKEVYSTLSFAVTPAEDRLDLALFSNGEPIIRETFSASAAAGSDGEDAGWFDQSYSPEEALTVFAVENGLSIVLDELGIYHKKTESGDAIDPKQFFRAMELKYGKSLIFADGFDGKVDEQYPDKFKTEFYDSRMNISPGGWVEFPSIYPGYEEIVITLAVVEGGSEFFEITFRPDGDNSEIFRAVSTDDGHSSELQSELSSVSFSLVFSRDESSFRIDDADSSGSDVDSGSGDDVSTNLDFGGIVYRLVNNDDELSLELENILVIRKELEIAQAGEDIGIGNIIPGSEVRSGPGSGL